MDQEKKYNIIVFGSQNVGKSSIITRYVENSSPSILQSVFNYYTKNKEVVHEGEKMHLEFDKISKLDDLTEEKVKLAEGFIFVYDVTIPDSIDDVIEGRNKIFSLVEPMYIKFFPVLVVGNKFDVENQEIKENFKLEEFLKTYSYLHMHVSAKNSLNVENLFNNMISQIKIFERMKLDGKFDETEIRDKNCCIIF